MPKLKETENFFWNVCSSSYLGEGSYGVVYKGTNKNTGESVAVKTFDKNCQISPNEVQKTIVAEFAVLNRLKHKNIVKLLALEEIMDNRKKVIIMELCTGGNLLKILEDPENLYGMPEPEFLLILKHLSDGIKYLRDNNIVHRDLKPGNIMKFISEDNQTIYKLIDFGAAKELEENQAFASLHGTKEYLHPNLFEKAFIKNKRQTFTANVDLWSIGVTLYHLATGGLPFQALGGQRSSQAMHFITSTKEAGVISGIQEDDGTIKWSTTLPKHCRFSEGLKSLLVPLLGGLLEQNPEEMWSFDHFFKQITIILNKIILHIFYMNQTSHIKLFLDPEDKFDVLQEHLREKTEVLPEKQILLFGNDHFERKVGALTNAKDYPKTKMTNPIYLFCATNNNLHLNCSTDLPRFRSFAEDVYPEYEAQVAKYACGAAYEYKRIIESFTTIDVLIKNGMEQFIEVHKLALNKMLRTVEGSQELLKTMTNLLDVMSYLGADAAKEIVENLNALEVDFQTAYELIQLLHKRFSEDNLLILQKLAIWDQQSPYEQKVNERVENLVQCLRQSISFFIQNRHKKGLEYSEKQLHRLEEIKFTTNLGHIKSLLTTTVQPNMLKMIEIIADSYNLAQTLYVQTNLLEIEIQKYQKKFEIIHKNISPTMDNIKAEGMKSKNESFLDQTKRKEMIDKLICVDTEEFRTFEQKQRELLGEMVSYIKTDVKNTMFLD